MSTSIDTPASDLTSVTPLQDAALAIPLASNELSEAVSLLSLIQDEGLTVGEAGRRLNLSRSTAFRRLALVENDTERGVVKLLSAKAIDFAEDWSKASTIAAEKGDHRPAKDALLAIKAIEPVGESAGTNIAILIGTPEQPIRIQSPAITVTPTDSST